MYTQGDYVSGMSGKAEAFRRHRGKDRTSLELLRDVFEDWSDIICALDCIDKSMNLEPTTTKFASSTGASPIRLRGGMTENADYISAGVWCLRGNNVDEHSSPRSSPRSPRSLDMNTREASSDDSDVNGANCERIGSGPATTEQPFHFKIPGMLSGTIGLPRRFGNPVESASRDLKQENMNPDSASSAEHTVKSSLRCLLRKVRVNEGLLHEAIESLGGGEKGLKVVIEFIKYFQEFEEQNAGNVSPDAFIRGLHQVCMLRSQQRQRERVSSGGENSIGGIADSTIASPHRSEEIDLEKQPRVDDEDTRASQQASIPCHMVPNEQFNRGGGHENWYSAARGHVVLPGRGGMTYLGGPPFLGAYYPNFYCAYPPNIGGCSPVSPCVQLVLAPVRGCPNMTTSSAESVHEEAIRRASRKSRIARRKVHLNLQQPMQQANSTTTGRGGSCGEAAVQPTRGNYEETVRPISAARQQARDSMFLFFSFVRWKTNPLPGENK